MAISIKMNRIVRDGNPLYEMALIRIRPIDSPDLMRFTFPFTTMGWLNMQVAKDSIKDSLENITVHDETEDPR